MQRMIHDTTHKAQQTTPSHVNLHPVNAQRPRRKRPSQLPEKRQIQALQRQKWRCVHSVQGSWSHRCETTSTSIWKCTYFYSHCLAASVSEWSEAYDSVFVWYRFFGYFESHDGNTGLVLLTSCQMLLGNRQNKLCVHSCIYHWFTVCTLRMYFPVQVEK